MVPFRHWRTIPMGDKRRPGCGKSARLVRWYRYILPKYNVPPAVEIISWPHELVPLHRRSYDPPQDCGGRFRCCDNDRGNRHLRARAQSRHGYHDRADPDRYQGRRPGGLHRPQRSGYPLARRRLLTFGAHISSCLRAFHEIVRAAQCPLLARRRHRSTDECLLSK